MEYIEPRTVSCKVKRIEEYGVYLTSEYKTVLVLITDLGARVRSPNEAFQIGDNVLVNIFGYVRELDLYRGSIVPGLRDDPTIHLDVPSAIERAVKQGAWRDPGSAVLRDILSRIPNLPEMNLFPSIDAMRHVARAVKQGGYIDIEAFCMVPDETARVSLDDPRLVFSRSLFVAGSTVPGDDVLVVASDCLTGSQQIIVFDWDRPVPFRWVPVMSVEEFCNAIAAAP